MLHVFTRLTVLITIAGSIAASTGAWAQDAASPMGTGYAPAEIKEPFLPKGDPVDPGAVSSLTLEQVLIYADANAPAIKTARARVGIADATMVNADISLPANPEIAFAGGGRTIEGTTGFEFEVAIQQQLEIAGQPGLRRAAAKSQQIQAQAAVNEVRWSLHVEAHRLLVNLLLVKQRREQAERFVAFSKAAKGVAERQIEAGESSPLILLVAEADLARTQEAVIETRRLDALLRARLAAVIGWPNATLPPIEGTLPAVKPAPKVEQLLELMRQHHPALRTRELAVAAQRSWLALQNRIACSNPTLGFSYGREAAPFSGAEAHVWLFNISMPIPLFRYNQGDRAQAEAMMMVADRERTETAIELRTDLIQATISLDAAAERVALYETSIVPQLEKNLTMLQKAYELGEVDVHQVSQTRERLLNATAKYILARVAYYETAATLEGLVGTEIFSHSEGSQ